MEYYLFSGKYNDGIEWIQKEKKKKRDLAQLNQYEGDFYKLKGDLEEALIHWKESNNIRSCTYRKGNYHLAWNYALLSNYYFEKIETKLAKLYADSCSSLIQDLSIAQQREIEVFKIWNILAQSNKQFVENNYMGLDAIEKYNWIRGFYAKSKSFIIENELPSFYLAKTYHLIGNSYMDNIHAHIKVGSSSDKVNKVFKNAEENYNIALNYWTKIFGNIHHERAKTLYLMGMLHMLNLNATNSNKYSKSSRFFDEAINAFGIDVKQLNDSVLKQIPNKEDALQCLRYKNITLFKQIEELNKIELIESAEKLSKQGIRLWEITYNEFKSENTNQLLGIYNLIPFKDVIQIETLKRKNNLQFSVNRIFNANEKLKYYDLTKLSTYQQIKPTSIKAVQQKLKANEVFLDFLSNQYNQYFMLVIEKNEVSFREIDYLISSKIQAFKQAIIDFNFVDYSKLGADIFQDLFYGTEYRKWKKIVICPDGDLNSLPFEALLWSKKNAQNHDYRKLNYVIKHIQIEYTLAPSFFSNGNEAIRYSISCFAPVNSRLELSELPFSQQLIEKMEKLSNVSVYKNETATKLSFLNAKSSILHFSGHGLIDSKSSLNNALVFSDSMLALEDLQKFKSPNLVILNACNSSNGKIIPGDGVDGFVRAFHAAGAKVTIANLWEVDDKVSNELFFEFYNKLGSRKTIARLMQQTKLNYLKTCTTSDFSAPYYWAGHRVIGDGVILQNEKTPQSFMSYWIVGVLVSVIYLIVRTLLKSRKTEIS